MIAPYTIVLDTNIFGAITNSKGTDQFDWVFKTINEYFNKDNKYNGFYPTITPFLMLEYLGTQISDINITDLESMPKNIDAVQYVFNKAQKQYAAESYLQHSKLVSRFDEQLKYAGSHSKKLMEDMVGNVLRPSKAMDWVYGNLAMDYTYRFEYLKHGIKDDDLVLIYFNSILDCYRAEKDQRNLSQTRGIFYLSKDLRRRNKENFIQTKVPSRIFSE